ncbi:MAG: acyl-CoA dehydrogenase family protein [Deltaproteobacteria bacterium]|nr:acyl-CoA dehydrogenase family protein [Deltaproteobacteria bacterium]
MDLRFSEEETLIRDMAREFARNELKPNAGTWDEESRFPEDKIRSMAELGLMGVNVPESLGGAEAGPVALSLAVTEIAKGCASCAVTLSVTNMVCEVITAFGTEAQKLRYCPKITSGEYVAGAFSLSEAGAGSDPGGMKTTAVRKGDRFILNGEKMWITSGAYAGVHVVWARTGGKGAKGISCFLVEAGTPGMKPGKKENKMGLRASNTCPVLFEDCEVGEDALLGVENEGFKVAMMALDGGRIGIASQALGIGLAAQEAAVAYAKERQQFGQAIANFEAIQWMLADSETDLSAARQLTYRAAWLKGRHRPFSQEASMAKTFSTEAAWRVCDNAVQVHGGYGYVKEYEVERHYRDIRATRIYEGTNQIQRVVIARNLLCK